MPDNTDEKGTSDEATYCGAEYGEAREGECGCPRCAPKVEAENDALRPLTRQDVLRQFGDARAGSPNANFRDRVLALLDRLAAVESLADDLAAWDLVDMPVPDSVDVPDDYELGMNHAGAQLHAALSTPPGTTTGGESDG